MHIILEGPDGAGKTTLAQALIAQHGYAYRHEGPPPRGTSPVDYYVEILDSLRTPTLLDRFHLGEQVYGPLLRGTIGLTVTDLATINLRLRRLSVRVILCLPPFAVVDANWSARHARGGELLTDRALLAQSYGGFSALRLLADDLFDYTTGDSVIPFPQSPMRSSDGDSNP